MPAAPLANTFEGGTNTTAITTANSGGASGNAFSTVTGTIATFSNTHARGALSMQVAQGATFASSYVRWTGLGALTTDVWMRVYIYLTALPATAIFAMRFWDNTATPANSASIRIATTGVLQAFNAAGGAIVATLGTTVLPLNQWNRVEMRCRSSTTAGQVEWRLYTNADSDYITETKNSGTAEVFAANTDAASVGMASSGPINYTNWYDDFAVSTAGWIGPAARPPRHASPVPMMRASTWCKKRKGLLVPDLWLPVPAGV